MLRAVRWVRRRRGRVSGRRGPCHPVGHRGLGRAAVGPVPASELSALGGVRIRGSPAGRRPTPVDGRLIRRTARGRPEDARRLAVSPRARRPCRSDRRRNGLPAGPRYRRRPWADRAFPSLGASAGTWRCLASASGGWRRSAEIADRARDGRGARGLVRHGVLHGGRDGTLQGVPLGRCQLVSRDLRCNDSHAASCESRIVRCWLSSASRLCSSRTAGSVPPDQPSARHCCSARVSSSICRVSEARVRLAQYAHSCPFSIENAFGPSCASACWACCWELLLTTKPPAATMIPAAPSDAKARRRTSLRAAARRRRSCAARPAGPSRREPADERCGGSGCHGTDPLALGASGRRSPRARCSARLCAPRGLERGAKPSSRWAAPARAVPERAIAAGESAGAHGVGQYASRYSRCAATAQPRHLIGCSRCDRRPTSGLPLPADQWSVWP